MSSLIIINIMSNDILITIQGRVVSVGRITLHRVVKVKQITLKVLEILLIESVKGSVCCPNLP